MGHDFRLSGPPSDSSQLPSGSYRQKLCLYVSLWDVLFKTYEVPQTNKDVHFGISKTKPNIYTTCMALYLLPFKFAFAPVVKHLKDRKTLSAPTLSTL
ncbi:hypothetical protein [Aliamphritea spongicola]|nr:hypothetical protein [Aliamphritea spongicola]